MTDQKVETEMPEEGLFGEPVDAHAVFDRDVFLLRQKMMAISDRYIVSDEDGTPLVFVRRPARVWRGILALLAAVSAAVVSMIGGVLLVSALESATGPSPVYGFVLIFWSLVSLFIIPVAVAVWLSVKRHVYFWADEAETQALIEVEQEHKWQVPIAWYRVKTPEGVTLARLRKNHLHNLFRKIWTVHDDGGVEWLRVYEDSVVLSIGRRLFGPMFGVLRTNFVFKKPGHKAPIGKFDRKFTILDRYALDLRADEEMHIDRRVAVALGVMLDTGERR